MNRHPESPLLSSTSRKAPRSAGGWPGAVAAFGVPLLLVLVTAASAWAQGRGSGPNLKTSKTNDTGGQFEIVDGSFQWSILIDAVGDANSDFLENEVVLRDELPTNATYGSPNVVQNGVTGTLSCSIAASVLTCSASGGAYKMPAGSGATVSFSVTPTEEGTLANPRSGGVCAVDPDNEINEQNESDNSCSDSVQIIGIADLIATKTNDAGGVFDLSDGSFNWSITVSNIGTSAMVWENGQAMLNDELPQTGVAYGAAQISAQQLASGSPSCGITGSTAILCTANGQVTMEVGGFFTVTVPVTPSSAGVLENPREGGDCMAISQFASNQESDATNNDCSDSVTVLSRPDLTATKTNDVGGSMELAEGSFIWEIVVANEGTAPATFGQVETVFSDTLAPFPHPDVLYAEPAVTSSSGITGSITCLDPLDGVDEGYLVQCLSFDSGGVTIDPGGSFTVEIEVTPLVAREFVNPNPGSPCRADPSDKVEESNEDNNDCSDTVDVADSPDVTATKTNDADGVVEVGVPFEWSILLENHGGASFEIPGGGTVLVDHLPDGLDYGAPTINESVRSPLSGQMTCSINAADVPAFPGQQVLTCVAEPGGIVLIAGGRVAVEWQATPTTEGAFENPQAGVCLVDPDDAELELDETNNDCADWAEVPIFADGFESGNITAWN